MPGVFVAGDVRKGSVKRLTCAAGEGAMAVQYIHQYNRGGAAVQRGSGAGERDRAAQPALATAKV